MHRLPQKPAKVTVPQIFNVEYGPGKSLPAGVAANQYDPGVWYEWIYSGGGEEVLSKDMNHTKVIWHTTGQKEVKLHISATGVGCMIGGIKVNKTCDTTLTYCVQVHEKHLGFFVDQQVDSKVENSLHNGTSWANAFPTLQQALALASQGDYIWVAEGTYSPRDSFPEGIDYAKVSTAGYLCDYDSLTVYTPSYVMDWDSVQVFGGFAGTERNLSERNLSEHPTVLSGGDRSVIVMDGGTTYTNGLWGLTHGARWDGFTIRDGVAARGGGILFRNGATGIFSNDVIKQNVASGAGGGVYIDGPYTGPQPGDEPVFFQVEVSGNRAADGGGIYNNGSNAMLVNTTVAGNYATRAGGGLNNASGNPQILNTILWSNSSGNGNGNDVIAGGTPYYSHSDVGGALTNGVWNAAYGTDGGQNLSVDPYFISTGDPEWPEGNYRLSYPSRVMDGGNNRYAYFGELLSIQLSSPDPRMAVYNDRVIDYDLANQPRVMYNYVDMGAYEYILPDASAPRINRKVVIPAVEGVRTQPPAGTHYVESNRDFTFTVFPKEGYTLENLKISSGFVRIDEEKTTLAPQEDGSVRVTFHEVIEPLYVTMENVMQVTVGNGPVDRVHLLWAGRDRLHVQTTEAAELEIYTVAGRLHTRQAVAAGNTEISLPQGVYIVRLNGNGVRHKIVIRQ
ncbi:MAG: T9SS type A sorting domain-containing protein [Tannerella sp.]|nr:T9SS type A sorting domain-containing protein [Tannerella sp.]